MKRLLILGLAVAGVAVVGADQAPAIKAAPARVEIAYARTEPIPAPAKAPVRDDLDIANFVRERKDLEIGDLFGAPTPPAPSPAAVPAAAPKAEPVAAPSVPPLPFTYLGRMTKSGKVIVYLLRNQEMLLAEAGATLDSAYRVENITGSTVQFVYLPLQARQDLSIPPTP